MKACVLEGPKNYQIKDIPVPEMKEDEVLVRVLTSGICVNDVRDYQGCNGHIRVLADMNTVR